MTQTGNITTSGEQAHGILAQSAGGVSGGADTGGPVHVSIDGNILAGGLDAHGIIAQSLGSEANGDITVDVLSGTVQGGSGTGTGILFLDGDANALNNHGTVTSLGGLEGFAIRGTGGDETIENYGVVRGQVGLGGGTNTFDNHEGGLVESGASIDLGADGVFTNAGTLSPGGAAGVQTTTIGCDFTQTGTGVLEVTVGHDVLDKVVVIGGTATLDGTLRIVPGASAYLDGTTYDVLEASDYQGTFDAVDLPHTAFLDFGMDYLPGGVRLSAHVETFGENATNPMQRAIAGQLDACLPTAQGDMSRLIGSFQLASEAQVSEAFSSLSPDTYDNLTRGALQSLRLHQDGLAQRMDAARTVPAPGDESPAMAFQGGSGWWLGGAREGADQDESGGYLAHNFTISGARGGYERASGRSVVGASFGTTLADVDRDNDLASGSANQYLGSIYGGRIWGGTFAQGVATFGFGSFENRRDIHVGSLDRVARGEYNGTALSALVTGGRRILAGRWSLEPFASLRYDRLSEDGFSETGAEAADLIVGSRTTDWLGSDVGMRFATCFAGRSSSFLPELRVGWIHDFALDNREFVAAFEGDPTMRFALAGQDIKKDGVAIGAGFSWHTLGGWKASVRYDREQRSDFSANSLTLRVGSGF